MSDTILDAVDDIKRVRDENSDKQLEEYFQIYSKLDRALGETSSDSDEKFVDSLLNAQSLIIAAVVNRRSSDFAGVMFKMSMWRLENSELNSDLFNMSRLDSLAYSAFRDLVYLLDQNTHLKDSDLFKPHPPQEAETCC